MAEGVGFGWGIVVVSRGDRSDKISDGIVDKHAVEKSHIHRGLDIGRNPGISADGVATDRIARHNSFDQQSKIGCEKMNGPCNIIGEPFSYKQREVPPKTVGGEEGRRKRMDVCATDKWPTSAEYRQR